MQHVYKSKSFRLNLAYSLNRSVKSVRVSFTIGKFVSVLLEDSEGGINCIDGIISITESLGVGNNIVIEFLGGWGNESFIELDLSSEVVSSFFLFRQVSVDLSLGSNGIIKSFGLFLSESGDFRNESIVVFLWADFTISVFIVRLLDGNLDWLELGNNVLELIFVELGGQLDESLDGIGLWDSAQSTFDFLLGDLEESVTTGLEGL